jgi:hypothetical protein
VATRRAPWSSTAGARPRRRRSRPIAQERTRLRVADPEAVQDTEPRRSSRRPSGLHQPGWRARRSRASETAAASAQASPPCAYWQTCCVYAGTQAVTFWPLWPVRVSS